MKKIILLFLIALVFLPAGNSQIKNSILVAAYNLRYANSNDGINSWTNRKDQVKGLIQFHNFDIFGTEEGLMEQLNDIAQLKQYAFIGEGRDGGIKGEHSAIFYRKTRFKLLDSGNFWLSETPEKPSYGWDAKHCRRICSWGKFKDLQSNKEFCFFCVHFDNEGIEAQRQSAKLMVSKIKEIAKNIPAICVGDFNSTPETEQIICMQTLLNDAYKISLQPPYGPIGTFNGFKFNESPAKERIDYIFVSKQIKILKYGVLTDSYEQRYPSDHFPIVAEIINN